MAYQLQPWSADGFAGGGVLWSADGWPGMWTADGWYLDPQPIPREDYVVDSGGPIRKVPSRYPLPKPPVEPQPQVALESEEAAPVINTAPLEAALARLRSAPVDDSEVRQLDQSAQEKEDELLYLVVREALPILRRELH